MIVSDIEVVCPNCYIFIHIPFLPYDLAGDFVPQEGTASCPKCGFPVKFDTKEIEKGFKRTGQELEEWAKDHDWCLLRTHVNDLGETRYYLTPDGEEVRFYISITKVPYLVCGEGVDGHS